MKYLTHSLLLILILLSSCKNEDYIISEEINPQSQSAVLIQIEGVVVEEFSHFDYQLSGHAISNAEVRLMHEGIQLDAVNTNESGRYTFPEQAVPIEEAYLIFEAPGFYKNVSKINQISSPDIDLLYTTLIRGSFEGLTGDAISDNGSYINLKIGSASTDHATPILYYITNSENKLIGAGRQFVEAPQFEVTTLADEPLTLHYLTECSDQSTEIGPFSEDTDITGLLGEIAFDEREWKTIEANAYDCDGEFLTPAYYDFLVKINDVTRWYNNGSGSTFIGRYSCVFENYPNMLVSLVTKNPRRYGEIDYNYSLGDIVIPDITICEEDDTYFNYNIAGGIEEKPDLFTYANILSDGTIILKQKGSEFPPGNEVALQIFETDEGGTINIKNLAFTSPRFQINGRGLNVNITLSDEKFIEGNVEGEVLDAFESTLGNLSATFRARIL